jgi:hypothetical protein
VLENSSVVVVNRVGLAASDPEATASKTVPLLDPRICQVAGSRSGASFAVVMVIAEMT